VITTVVLCTSRAMDRPTSGLSLYLRVCDTIQIVPLTLKKITTTSSLILSCETNQEIEQKAGERKNSEKLEYLLDYSF